MPDESLNFLVSSAGRRGELVQILRESVRMLGGRGGVYCVDRSPFSAAAQLADGFDVVPPVTSSDFVPALLTICQARAIGHLIPTIDTELPVLAKERTKFAEVGTHVWVSDPEAVAIAQDKRLTNSWLVRNGFPAPKQLELAQALDNDELVWPLIAKPAKGSSSVGLHRINSKTELAALRHSEDYVVETVAPGHEHTVDVWVDGAGECRASVPRKRLETRAGEVSKGVTVRDESLMSLASRIASRLPGARGILNIQIFMDPVSGALTVIEVNARFGGGFPLAWAAGAHMPVWEVQDHAGTAPVGSLNNWQSDLLMLRYDQGLYVPIPAVLS